MSIARYFVFQRGRDWMVTLDGTSLGHHLTRPAALSSAIVMADLMGAMHHDADVMVESDGKLEIAWTYGDDPLPQIRSQAA
jgi:hypothetical protein